MAEKRGRPALHGVGAAVVAAAFGLGGCAETELAIHAAKQIVPGTQQTVQHTPGVYKVGKPYQINGIWYYPAIDYAYAETGIASWYGPDFHGKRTANGETFDMNTMTAAHKSLPMPSVVRVINLRNGRAVKLRVNDRGPFVNGRIIDVSRRAAQLLGFETAGTAPVRVEIVADESRQLAMQGGGGTTPLPASPSGRVTVEPLAGSDRTAAARPPQIAAASDAVRTAPPRPLTAEPEVSMVPVNPDSTMYVQAGAFVQRDYAIRLQQRLSGLGPARVVSATVGDRRFWRVQIGPVASLEEADRLLDRVLASGQSGARLVVD